MRALVASAVLAIGFCVANTGHVIAGERGALLLTPTQRRAYHECLHAAWVQDYCHWNAVAFGSCVIGNGGGTFPLDSRRFTDDYCWAAAQNLSR